MYSLTNYTVVLSLQNLKMPQTKLLFFIPEKCLLGDVPASRQISHK